MRSVLACSTIFLLCTCILSPPATGQVTGQSQESAGETVGFDQVQPILRKRCQNCHNQEELRGELSVSDFSGIKAGSSSGPVIVPFKPKESLLYTTTAHLDEPTMPPNSRKIPAREIEVIRKWIEGGLVQRTGDAPPSKKASMKEGEAAVEENASTGSFQPIASLLRPASIPALAVHPTESLVALSGDRQVVLLDAQKAELLHALNVDVEQVTELAFSDDGKRLIVAGGTPGSSGSVFVFDNATGKQVGKVADETDSILALDVAPDMQSVAIGGPSKKLRLMDVKSGEVKFRLDKHTDWVLTAAFSPDGLLCASGDRFGGLFVWETATGKLFQACRGHQGPVHAVVWDKDGETLLSGGEDGIIRVWNMHHGELTAQWDAQVGPILDLDRAAGVTIAAGRDRKASAWSFPDTQSGIFEADSQLDRIRISASTGLAITTDASGRIYLLGLPGLELKKSLAFPTNESGVKELLAKLESQSEEYAALEQQRRADAMLAEQARRRREVESQLSMRSSEPPTPSVDQSVLGVLRNEIAAVERQIELQQTMRNALVEQTQQMEQQLVQQDAVLAASQSQLSRLQALVAQLTAQPMSQAARAQAMKEQLVELKALRETAEQMKERSQQAASKSAVISGGANWMASITAIDQLTSALGKQEAALQAEILALSRDSVSAVAGSPLSQSDNLEDAGQ